MTQEDIIKELEALSYNYSIWAKNHLHLAENADNVNLRSKYENYGWGSAYIGVHKDLTELLTKIIKQ